MKFIYCHDLHGQGKNPSMRLDNYRASWLKKIEEIGELCLDHHSDIVVCGGDVFSSPNVSNTLIDDFIDIIESYEVPWYIVPGNHDEIGHNWELSKGSALAHMFRRSKLINQLTELNLDDCFIKGIAYYHGIEEDIRKPIINDETKLKILVPHAMISKSPLHPAINHVLIGDIETNFDWVLCSHLHDNWGIEDCNDTKYVNIGAIGRTSIPERDKNPRVAICDTVKETIDIVDLKCAKSGEEVFNVKAYEEIKGERKDIETFIKSLEDVKFQSTHLRDKVSQMCKENKVNKEIQEYLLNKIQEIEV